MPVIFLSARIHAPIELVFDLSRSVDVHLDSSGRTNEEVIAGRTTGLLELGDQVTWRATHFGVRQTLTSRITKYDRPHLFRDSMVTGAFRRMDHDHLFSTDGDATVVEDRFDFESPLGPLGWIANRLFVVRHMRAFLEERMQAIKEIAESGAAQYGLSEPDPGPG